MGTQTNKKGQINMQSINTLGPTGLYELVL